MVEQAQAGERHCNTVLVAGLNNIVITDRAACLCNILHAAAMRTLNVIAEREECVTAKSNVLQLSNPSLFLFASKRFRFFGEEVFPYAVSQYILIIIGDVNVDGVVAVGRRMLSLNGRANTFGFWRSHQISALPPARRVQCTRDCWPAPMPIA